MENVFANNCEGNRDHDESGRVYVPYPGADEKYDNGQDWRLYNPEKYLDPNWSPDKE